MCGGSNNVASGTNSFVGGGKNNTASGVGSAVVGGGTFSTGNTASGTDSIVISGNGNVCNGTACIVAGGSGNSTSSTTNSCGIIGGNVNSAGAFGTNNAICGGITGGVNGTNNVICGGDRAVNNGINNAILGGVLPFFSNTASNSAIVSGGRSFINAARSCVVGVSATGTINVGGTDSIILGGRNCTIGHATNFMYNTLPTLITSNASNSVTLVNSTGMRCFSNNALTLGVNIPAGGTAWAAICDENKKKNLIVANYDEILQKVNRLPVFQYNFKNQTVDHVTFGPMAQDWHAEFKFGTYKMGINTMDLDGVALAAIKGLTNKLNRLETFKETIMAKLLTV